MLQDEEIIRFAKEIIDDPDLGYTHITSLVTKASRLASLVNDVSVKKWLTYEKYGYNDTEESIKVMLSTGRSYDKVTKIGLWGGISSQVAAIDASLAELEVVKNFKPSGTYSTIQFQSQIQQVRTLTGTISKYKRICSIVALSIHDFASRIYFAYRFGKRANTLIEEYRKTATEGIAKLFPELNQSFEAIDINASDINPRNWSAAASECRNIFINLSSKLWKNTNPKYKCKDGQEIEMEKEKNKLLAYVDKKMSGSNEGRARAKKLFGIIHEIFTLGGKSKREIDKKELSTAILDTYVFLNDLISYTDIKPIE